MLIKNYKHYSAPDSAPLSDEERKELNDEVNRDYLKSNRRKRKAMKGAGLVTAGAAGYLLGGTIGGNIGEKVAKKNLRTGNWPGKKRMIELANKIDDYENEKQRLTSEWLKKPFDSSGETFRQLSDSKKFWDKVNSEREMKELPENYKEKMRNKYGIPGSIIGAAATAAAAYGGYKLYKHYKNKKKQDNNKNEQNS
jgi:hypothetical protein